MCSWPAVHIPAFPPCSTALSIGVPKPQPRQVSGVTYLCSCLFPEPDAIKPGDPTQPALGEPTRRVRNRGLRGHCQKLQIVRSILDDALENGVLFLFATGAWLGGLIRYH